MPPTPTPSALTTDLYELTMAAGYYVYQERGRATFELWVRDLPPERGFLVAAGVDQGLDYLENLQFRSDEVAYLRQQPALAGVPASFFDDYLPSLRFTGDVWAIPEGTPVFAAEPLVRVTAPLPEAQIVETALLSTVLFQTSIASKAARVVSAAGGRPVIEFGGRRAHGTAAAVLAARAAFIGGCAGTSNVEAGYRFDIPISGTMAHSWVMTHATEQEAFERFSAVYGDQAVLLIDTYDTVEAARALVRSGLRPAAVRLDSGDLVALSRTVRSVLDAGDLRETRIFASGELDEHRVAALLETGAPIDAFGVGTALSTSADAPALGGVYKLVEVARGGRDVPTMKLSRHKLTYPGSKQVWRVCNGGRAQRDVIEVESAQGPPDAEPLLGCVMRQGRRLQPGPPLTKLRTFSAARQAVLPEGVRRLVEPARYPVEIGRSLQDLGRHVSDALEASRSRNLET